MNEKAYQIFHHINLSNYLLQTIEGKISQKRTFLVKSIRHAILLPEKEAPTKVVFS